MDPLNDPSHPDHSIFVQALRESRTSPTGNSISIISHPYDVNRVHDNLWMGGIPPTGRSIGQYFDCLVLAAREYQASECYRGIQVTLAYLNDDGTPMTKDEAKDAVRTAGKVIKWLREGLRVLVTCHSGLNRSGLITAIALCKYNNLSPQMAVNAIRIARGHYALRNPYFLKFLQEYCGNRSRP